ncbi:hypothetical protein [Neotabrizicola shimadae]|uniref:Uncharacterized protein n=1 Tax=Neotabrizicola shimadae TaxID=2807096 RepID=A0A8G1EAJ6_9RHOB|nr:hypothetical protein [Neotabrizicola shimadae]QYZ68680.1 hypothetical protein JO391_12980 [Neotabrizicola shimadae]
MAEGFTFTARILRKEAFLPRYVVVKPEFVLGRTGSFAALVSLNGSAPFARTVHPWGKGSEAFFFNLTEPQCRKAGVDTGSVCEVRVEPLDR